MWGTGIVRPCKPLWYPLPYCELANTRLSAASPGTHDLDSEGRTQPLRSCYGWCSDSHGQAVGPRSQPGVLTHEQARNRLSYFGGNPPPPSHADGAPSSPQSAKYPPTAVVGPKTPEVFEGPPYRTQMTVPQKGSVVHGVYCACA